MIEWNWTITKRVLSNLLWYKRRVVLLKTYWKNELTTALYYCTSTRVIWWCEINLLFCFLYVYDLPNFTHMLMLHSGWLSHQILLLSVHIVASHNYCLLKLLESSSKFESVWSVGWLLYYSLFNNTNCQVYPAINSSDAILYTMMLCYGCFAHEYAPKCSNDRCTLLFDTLMCHYWHSQEYRGL